MTPQFKQHEKSTRPMSDSAQHSLDDVEFYTDLADAIEDFKELLTHAVRGRDLTRTERLQAVKRFVGLPVQVDPYDAAARVTPSRFFRDLARQAGGKYKKAVSELMKAVL